MTSTRRVAEPAASFFSALDRAPMTWRHYLIWLLASGGALLDGFSVVALGVALPLLKRSLELTPLLTGLIGSALVLGAAVSAWVGGILADRFGRKRVMILDMATVAVASLVGAFAPNPFVVLIGQFLLGVGIGADFPTSGAYVSEMMPRAARSRMIVATIAMQSVGMVLAALVGLGILDFAPDVDDWRKLLGAAGVLALIFLCARMFAPESARWLVDKGRLPEARALLDRLAVEFHEPPPAPTAHPAAPAASPDEKSHGGGIGVLFGCRYRLRTALASLPWLLMDIATYGVGLFTPVILGALHFGAAGSGPIAADFADAKGSALVDVFLLVGFLAGLWAIPRFGRIPMQVAGFAGMTVGMLLLLFAAMAGDGGHAHLAYVIGGFVLFNFAMNAGPNGTTFTLAPSLFPTSVRASASGFAAGGAKVGATFGTFVVPQLHAVWGLVGVVGLMAAVSAAGLFATAALGHAVNEEGQLEE